ncbi:(2Fe-2S)-binding protein [Ancylobacter sp. WKF20]|uniref:(2Fe-2S)-binding protein n=1 Tax=Ancylobacter sp. WKF20 TaxID=3039801 RepID=UPI0024344D0A|nr:2Fe-2S iron-sulfur cluster-binding protein [Ancylobacter sp. WKF20]WGD31107.1 (2Fe-2S)-binding protein [Ancylobacter sp. WKF20]
MPIDMTVNGEARRTVCDPLTPLIDLLRDEFHLTGAKPVCREGFCGACTVLVNGAPTTSCLTPAALVEGCEVVTIEGMSAGDRLNPVQAQLDLHDAVQCGMCFPGMVVTLSHFLDHSPRPSRDDVRAALTGNICRCTGYERIVEAALAVAAGRMEVPR